MEFANESREFAAVAAAASSPPASGLATRVRSVAERTAAIEQEIRRGGKQAVRVRAKPKPLSVNRPNNPLLSPGLEYSRTVNQSGPSTPVSLGDVRSPTHSRKASTITRARTTWKSNTSASPTPPPTQALQRSLTVRTFAERPSASSSNSKFDKCTLVQKNDPSSSSRGTTNQEQTSGSLPDCTARRDHGSQSQSATTVIDQLQNTASRTIHLSCGMAQNDESDGTVAMPRLEDLLRHPEDLDKIPALKAEYARKKAAVDSQLQEGLRDQLTTVQKSLSLLSEGQRHVLKTRDELREIDKLCAESQTAVDDFSQIDKLAKIQRNFEATLTMKRGLETFGADLAEVEKLLKEDDQDLENQPNLLRVHMLMSRLRDFRDEAMDQIRKAQDPSNEATLVDYFQGLDAVVDWFDEHLGTACVNLIPLVQSDNRSMVVRLAIVVMNELKSDETVRAVQEAQKDHKELASRFKSMNIGPKTVRGYKEKFLKAIELYAQSQFDTTKDEFLGDPDSLEKSIKWFFNDLFTVQQGMQSLMPKKWKIYATYTNIYHRMMHDFLVDLINDHDLPPGNLLAIIHWSDKYYKKMSKLGWKQSDLVPNVLDDRESELIRQWQNIILNAVDEWMDRILAADKKALVERNPEAMETNAEGYFRTKALGDIWRMLHEQIMATSASERADVNEGVISAMFRALKGRQAAWQTLLDEECTKYKSSGAEPGEALQQLQDWLIAAANDQIACIDDNEETGRTGHLTRFRQDFESLVTPKYMASRASAELDALRNGYVDLSTHCISQFVDLIFAVDFRTTLPDFFTQKWYGEFAVKRITSTFEDYMTDYSSVLHSSLTDILVEELSDVLLARYLSAVHNRGVKFRRQDPFTDKFKDDVLTVFAFFQKFPDSFASTIKQQWRLVDWLVRLLESEKGPALVAVYEAFKTEYWDLQLSWVETVVRSRDDFERSMVSSIKAKAAELNVERGVETIMSKVR